MVGGLLAAVAMAKQAVGFAQFEAMFLSWGDMVERELVDWAPADSYQSPPGSRVTDASVLDGWWLTQSGHAVSNMFLRKNGDGTLRVTFRSSGCLGGWKLLRTAKFKDGIVWLDKPVKTYIGDTYDRLFVFTINGTTTLVPAGLMEDDVTSLSFRLEYLTLTKRRQ